jgi:hypothetical protein
MLSHGNNTIPDPTVTLFNAEACPVFTPPKTAEVLVDCDGTPSEVHLSANKFP